MTTMAWRSRLAIVAFPCCIYVKMLICRRGFTYRLSAIGQHGTVGFAVLMEKSEIIKWNFHGI